MPPTLTPQAFAAKQRSVSQEHFIYLCRLLGCGTPGESREGSLAFEAGAASSAARRCR
jgi:hypothetical protein